MLTSIGNHQAVSPGEERQAPSRRGDPAALLLSAPTIWSASDHALAYLIDLLRIDSLEIGAQLPGLGRLAEMIGVSHVVVREALNVLEAENIVQVRSGRGGGIFVSGASGFPRCLVSLYPEEGMELFPALSHAITALDREIMLLALRAQSEPDEVLEALVERMGESVDDGEVFVELTVRFRYRAARTAGNAVLMGYMRDAINRIATVGLRHRTAVLDHADRRRTHRVYVAMQQALATKSEADLEAALAEHLRVRDSLLEASLESL